MIKWKKNRFSYFSIYFSEVEEWEGNTLSSSWDNVVSWGVYLGILDGIWDLNNELSMNTVHKGSPTDVNALTQKPMASRSPAFEIFS